MNSIIKLARKYKVLHIAYWIWAFFGLIHQREELLGRTDQVPDAIIIICSQMLCVYTVIYLLVPKVLNRGSHLLFGLLTVACIIFFSFLSSLVQDAYTIFTEGKAVINLLLITFTQSVDMSVITGIFTAIVIISRRYEDDQHKKVLEKEKLESELKFLKAQINPHFLFNVLNSIYVLIDMDKKAAGDALLRFSRMLRYQLYECVENTVDIQKELIFLNDYIGMEKIRNGEYVDISVQLVASSPFNIAPFILVPFVENAFKHVSRDSGYINKIVIQAEANEEVFSFFVSNTYDNARPANGKMGGIGLQNVMRRLELIYPGKHTLEIAAGTDIFSIDLKLFGEKNEMYYN